MPYASLYVQLVEGVSSSFPFFPVADDALRWKGAFLSFRWYNSFEILLLVNVPEKCCQTKLVNIVGLKEPWKCTHYNSAQSMTDVSFWINRLWEIHSVAVSLRLLSKESWAKIKKTCDSMIPKRCVRSREIRTKNVNLEPNRTPEGENSHWCILVRSWSWPKEYIFVADGPTWCHGKVLSAPAICDRKSDHTTKGSILEPCHDRFWKNGGGEVDVSLLHHLSILSISTMSISHRYSTGSVWNRPRSWTRTAAQLASGDTWTSHGTPPPLY